MRQNGWIVLQYWFFYPFNNWRSGFFGANDHEADWEMICVYLAQDELLGEIYPAWVAYASHDYQGDDLRRRWDEPTTAAAILYRPLAASSPRTGAATRAA